MAQDQHAPSAPIRPFDARMLDAGDGHWLYVEEVGTRGASPVLFLHGGPGSGCQHAQRALFDLDRHHAFLFDQRGAGRSHPYLSRTANTTQHLIADIELIRRHFGIEKWLVTGGSWGATLALAYAQTHPERVTGLVLRAVFLGTPDDVRWAFVDGPQVFRPELYAAFRDWLPEAERDDPLAAYIERLTSDDPAVYTPAAHRWNAYERALSELVPQNTTLPDNFADDARLPPTPLMEAHYIANDFFLRGDQLLSDAHRLVGIPGILIQGRYDLLCPARAAHRLAARWPNARLHILDRGGHAMSDTGCIDAMREAIRKLAR